MKKAVISITSIITGAAVGAVAASVGTSNLLEKSISEKQKMSDKHLALYMLMNQWVKVKQEGKNLSQYFAKNGYHKIAIYGMSYVGETLINELKGTEIEIAYGIDKNAQNMYMDIDIVSPDDELCSVDAVVVTPITFFDQIEELLSQKLDCPIISIEDILYAI